MRKKAAKLRVLFNASVILAGVRSLLGASGTLLQLAEKVTVMGVVSELIFDEAARHAEKIGKTRIQMEERIWHIFGEIGSAPTEGLVVKYQRIVIDPGDAHVLATYNQEQCDVLVTLDKKHLLVLQGKVNGMQILTPGQFLNKFYPVETKRKS